MPMRNSVSLVVCWVIAAGAASTQPDAKPASSPSTDSAGDPLPAGAVARLGVTRFRHGGWNGGMAISPDSKTLVTTGEGGDIRFWDIASGKLLHDVKEAKRHFQGPLYSPDGKWLVTTAVAADFRSKQPAELVFWDPRTRKPGRTCTLRFKPDQRTTARFQFTPDGKFLIGAAEGHAVVLEAETGQELLRYRLGARPLGALALSPDGRLVAASEEYRSEVKLWAWESVDKPRVLKSDRDRGFGTLAFSPDGKLLFGRGRDTGDDGIAVWDVKTGKLVKEWVGHRSLDYASHFAIHPDGRLVAVVQNGNRDGDDGPGIFLWDFESGKLVRRLPSGGRPVLFSPDRRWLAARTESGARVWDLKTFQEVAVYEESHRGNVERMELSSRGVLATASNDNTIGLWDPRGKFLRKLPVGGYTWNMGFSADGSLLLVAHSNPVARPDAIDLWEVATGKKRYSLPGHGRFGGRRAVGFTADGAEFCSFGDDYFFHRYRTANGKALVDKQLIPTGMDAKQIRAGREDPGSEFKMLDLIGAKFTRDGKALVLARHQRIHVFDTADGAELRHFDTGAVLDFNGFALSPDGRWLLATTHAPLPPKANGQGRKLFVTIWELATGKRVRSTPLPEAYGRQVAWSPDGRYYAAVGTDYPRGQRVRVWERASGNEVHVLENLPESVSAVTFALDGRRLYTSLSDTTVVMWDLSGHKAR
jgi:WD40 repeat protein